eukprot:8480225-Pyramimonas_sp.AAC.1
MSRLGPQADSKGLRNPALPREVALEALTHRSSGHLVVMSCRSWGRLVASRSHQLLWLEIASAKFTL